MSEVTIRIKFSNGDVFDIDALHVARHRAQYYAALDVSGGEAEDFDMAFQTEVDFALGDEYELKDWMLNSMKWAYIASRARAVVPTKPPDYDGMFAFSDITVRRVETYTDKLKAEVEELRLKVKAYEERDAGPDPPLPRPDDNLASKL